MVQINQAMLNPSSIGSINYSPATTATAVGLQAVNQAKSQKNARIRQSLKEAEANRNLSNQAQASWTAAVNANPDLGATIELAPEAVKKAFKKVQSGNGGVADNTLIAGYFGAVDAEAKQAVARKNAIRLNQLDLATKEAQAVSAQAKAFVDQVGATPEAIIAQTQADRALTQAQTDQAQAEALLAMSKVQDGRSKQEMINAIANPQAAMETPQGVANVLPENIPTPATAPTSAPVPAPVPAPETLSEAEKIQLLDETPLSPTTVTDTETGKQFIQSADGTERLAVPQVKDPSGKVVSASSNQIAITTPLVAEISEESGMDTVFVDQTLRAINDYEKQKDDFVNRGIVTNKPTLSQRIAQLVDANVDFKEARQTAEEEAKSGILAQSITAEDKQKREDKFVQSFDNTQSGLRNALALNAQLSSISDQVKDNLNWGTTKWAGWIQRKTLDLDLSWLGFKNKDPVEAYTKLQRLIADATLGKIDEMKKTAAEMGGSGTGLGQVSIVEIDLLKNAQSSLSDFQKAPKLKENIDQYMYYKNTSAYSLYQQAVSKYGEALALTMIGGNKDQINRIAERIEYFETNTDFGKKLVAQSGSYADRSKAPLSRNIRSNNPLPQTSTLPINPSNIGM